MKWFKQHTGQLLSLRMASGCSVSMKIFSVSEIYRFVKIQQDNWEKPGEFWKNKKEHDILNDMIQPKRNLCVYYNVLRGLPNETIPHQRSADR